MDSHQNKIYDISNKWRAKYAQILSKRIIGFNGNIEWDRNKPDGTPRKLLDNSNLEKLGWKSKIDLNSGILKTYDWFLNNIDSIKQIKF